MSAGGTRPSDDRLQQIKGYAARSSVAPGEQLTFYVTVAPAQDYEVVVYRLGYYGGMGACKVATSSVLHGRTQPDPELVTQTGLIGCPWSPSWALDVPRDWTSGVYLAVLTNAKRFRSYVPFVVRDDKRRSGFLAVMGFSTYQAYNQYPTDGRFGRSLYFGYDPRNGSLARELRAREVSFGRPYANAGLPRMFTRDRSAIVWMERHGYDVSYAASHDLHTGLVAPERHQTLLFPSHDEYWSPQMRQSVQHAVNNGRNLAFLYANNIYWNIRFDSADQGATTVACYRDDPDPQPGPDGPTRRWRDLGQPEQALMGVQYRAVVGREAPLIVHSPRHWFWEGTGLPEGARLPNLVTGEADGVFKELQTLKDGHQTIVSRSPFLSSGGRRAIQNTSLYQTTHNGLIFVAGTYGWTRALTDRSQTGQKIARATTNLFERLSG